MRITQEAREQTRLRILQAARDLFRSGFAEATTRSIATRAGIAAGTLFNYFPSKEALGLALVQEATAEAEAELASLSQPGASLEETLFAHIAIQLRHFQPFRPWIAEVFEAALSPLRAETREGPGEFRRRHLERVQVWIDLGLGAHAERAIDLHLYWSLYLGVVSFWACDESEHQAATLALLDRSMSLFCRALPVESGHQGAAERKSR